MYCEGNHFGLDISNIESSGNADRLSDMLLDITLEFNLSRRIIGLGCDTENTNTGHFGGTCIKYELKIEKQLLRLYCRHHIKEIILKRVCEKLLGSSNQPNFSFDGLDQLKLDWKNINKNLYLPFDEEESFDPIFEALKNEAIAQIQVDARNPNVRDDYMELNDICLKLFGVRTSKNIRVIGASSKARWISKALLICKVYLLRNQIDIEDDLLAKLRRISIFVCCLYTKFWNKASDVFSAPSNDLHFMQQLFLYKEYDNEIAQAGISAFREHLWYLGGELITLSLFSNEVSAFTKNKMRNKGPLRSHKANQYFFNTKFCL